MVATVKVVAAAKMKSMGSFQLTETQQGLNRGGA